MMKFEIAVKKYLNFMSRKGSSQSAVAWYKNKIENIFKGINYNWERFEIPAKRFENYIFKKNRTQNTKASTTYQLKSFLNFCALENLPVCNAKKILAPKFEDKEARYFRENELWKILKTIKGADKIFKTAIIFLLTTGTRISEACNITKKQILNALKIENTYQISICGKRNKTRAIFIPEKTWKLCISTFSLHNQKSALWLDKQQLTRKIRDFSKKIKIKFTAHTLRHTYLTRLAQNGADIYKIQKIAGHSSITTTTRYLHSCNRELAQASRLADFNL